MTQIGEDRASDDDSKRSEKEHCPVCGAVWEKLEPTLAGVRFAIRESAEVHRADINKLADDSMYGYRGSIATGVVGDHKPHKGLPPDIKGECGTKYDVDGFIITQFASKVKAFKGKRWASRNRASRKLESDMRKTHSKKPALIHMKGGKDGFSIVLYLPKDEDKAMKKGGILLIF